MTQLFSLPIFFILFRETFEASIVVSVMLSIVNKIAGTNALRNRMRRQVLWGTAAGISIALAFGIVIITLFYTVADDLWDQAEALWEAIFALIASILSTVMALAMVRVSNWRRKWEKKLTKITNDQLGNGSEVENRRSKYTLFLIPFSVVLREGVEAVVFVGGVGTSGPGSAIPIPAVVGATCGILVGYALYRGADCVAFKWFISAATLLLIVIAAGLFSFAVHRFEEQTENEDFVWKLECCDPGGANFWKLFAAITGWNNEATVGTLSAYISYWVSIVVAVPVIYIRGKRADELEAAEERRKRDEREAAEEVRNGDEQEAAEKRRNSDEREAVEERRNGDSNGASNRAAEQNDLEVGDESKREVVQSSLK